MAEPDSADDDGGDDGHGDEGVRDAAMMLQLLDRPGEAPEDVHVGGLGGQHGGQRGVGGFAVQAGAADAGAGKKVRDGFHSCYLHPILTGLPGRRGAPPIILPMDEKTKSG